MRQSRELEEMPSADRPPLWGIPFAVKDNIDVEGFNTTAACNDFAFKPEESAPAVQALLNAGTSCLYIITHMLTSTFCWTSSTRNQGLLGL